MVPTNHERAVMQLEIIAGFVCLALGAAGWILIKRHQRNHRQATQMKDMAYLEQQLMGEQHRDAA
jgi:positive regulator of sigma E activity